jgi:hypothetical protein
LQPAAGGGDQLGQLRVGRFDLLVDDREFGDQFGGELPAGAPDDVAGADRGQQCAGLWGGQELLRPARHQLEQQPVQPVDGVGAGPAEAVAAVDQKPQRDGGVIDDDLSQSLGA